jgi:hypothetical protein
VTSTNNVMRVGLCGTCWVGFLDLGIVNSVREIDVYNRVAVNTELGNLRAISSNVGFVYCAVR